MKRILCVTVLLSISALITSLFTPANSSADTTWQQTNGPTGGDIRSLAIDPSTPQMIYAGTDGGGIFKTTNGGTHWSVISASGLTGTFIQVLSLAIDPATTQTVYAGTWNKTSASGSVFKSTNGGSSWSAVKTGLAGPVFALVIKDRKSVV